jgi:hypothetical protein
MQDMMVWLEGTALSVWTRESGSIWSYPTILTLHTVGLGVVVGASAVVDFRLLGFAPRIPVPSLTPLFRFVWWAFALNAATGVVLFASEATDKSRQPVFYIKLALIALALWNTTLVQQIVCRPIDTMLSSDQARRGRWLAAASLSLWAGAIVAGRLMAYL